MALVMVIGMSAVLGITSTTAMIYSTENVRGAATSTANERSFSLAEAALNNLMSVLANPDNNALDPDIIPTPKRLRPGSSTRAGRPSGGVSSTATRLSGLSMHWGCTPTPAARVSRRCGEC